MTNPQRTREERIKYSDTDSCIFDVLPNKKEVQVEPYLEALSRICRLAEGTFTGFMRKPTTNCSYKERFWVEPVLEVKSVPHIY